MSKKIIIATLVIAAVAAYFVLDLERFVGVELLQQFFREQPFTAAVVYFIAYVLTTALSLPIATVLTLAGGAVFGLGVGLVLVSLASTCGATLAFLVSRTLLRDWIQDRFAVRLTAINRGVEKDGAFYLFSLRLIPVFPFWLINLAMGLTPLRIGTYIWVSLLGMLPATVVYVNAGAELAAVEALSVSGILTPGLMFSFTLLALLPYFARRLVEAVKRWRVYRPFVKPARFDTNLLVIGGGSGGLVAALIAAAVRARVTLVEKNKMGGDCLNTGCVPSKALIRAARAVADIRRASDLGIEVAAPRVQFDRVMDRVQSVIDSIAPHDSIARFTGLGVDCVEGEATLVSPWEVRVGENLIRARSIVIATGAAPFVPPVPGIEQVPYLTSDTLWQLREQPKHLLVLGAGPIGCELAQAFSRLGTAVTMVDMMPRVLPREDEDVSALIQARFVEEGINLYLGYKTTGFEQRDGGFAAQIENEAGQSIQLPFQHLLVAVGRKASTEGLGLARLGIETTSHGTLEVDEYLRTRVPNIYACGDVVGPYQFTHAASHQAWYAAVNALFGGFKRFRVDYRVLPWVTFTDPEVARVGISEAEARAQGKAYEITEFPLQELDRAIAENASEGKVKVLTAPGKDKILGAVIVGAQAGEMLTEFVSVMKRNGGLNDILGTVHAYPTLSEANKLLAGTWRREHAPQKLLHWVEKYHRWKLRGNALNSERKNGHKKENAGLGGKAE